MTGIAKSNLVLSDLTRKTRLPGFSSESSALYKACSNIHQQRSEESDNF